MHLLKNSVCFAVLMCVCGAAYSATPARVSIGAANVATASRRAPAATTSIRTGASVRSNVATTTTVTNTSAANLLSSAECIDEYRDCIKGDDACGSEFEECTTNVLFHGRMTECYSTLIQCPADAIQRLMGTSDLSLLSTVKTQDGDVVTAYAYPTDGSVMGMDIIAAGVRNKLSTADCVKKYKKCLNKDDVCGGDFELCTSNQEFARQAVMCDSTLSRCQKEGLQQLFGESQTTKPSLRKLASVIKTDGVIDDWISDGATLAASNAVNTCYKVVDSCFLGACKKNPYRCIEGVTFNVINDAEFVDAGEGTLMSAGTEMSFDRSTANDVRKFFRAQCEQTVGSNKYCQITHLGQMPKKSQLVGEDAQDLIEEVFDDMYATRNNKNILGTKINKIIEDFDKSAKDKCVETFKSCAIRSCGGGSGPACYNRVFGKEGVAKSINAKPTYDDIKDGCTAIINTDTNCKYMAATMADGGNEYSYSYEDAGAFEKLFPKHGTETTVIVDALNAALSTSYNTAAIEQMKKSCVNVVTNCVRSMCGKDYTNCYRNRSDVALGTYQTGNTGFNASMNKVGGVLDYTIVQGLCGMTVRNSEICADSLAIAKADISDKKYDSSMIPGWGNNLNGQTVGMIWRSGTYLGNEITDSDKVASYDANGHKQCECTSGGTDVCASEEGGNTDCQEPYMVDRVVAYENQAVNNLFQDILVDIEREAQALYKAKLTHEQNVCLANNASVGGAIANPDSTFVWAKLKGKKPNTYATNGLDDKWVQTNDLYDAFCRVKVTLHSDDKYIQQYLQGTGSHEAYFAVGDPFTCGSWLTKKDIDAISGEYAKDKTGTEKDGKLKEGQGWAAAGITALSSVAGIVGMDLLQSKTGLGGLLGTTTIKKDVEKLIDKCLDQANTVQQKAAPITRYTDTVKASEISALQNAVSDLRKTHSSLISKLELSTSYYEFPTALTAVYNIPAKDVAKTDSDASTAANAAKDVATGVATGVATVLEQCSSKMREADTDKLKDNIGGRVLMDVAGGAVLGTVGGITTVQIMKAKNREDFSKAQQEWLDEVGGKINCYVGGQSVGTMGDIVSFSIDDQ